MPGAVAFLKQDALHNFHSEPTTSSTWAPDDLLFPKTLRASRGAGFLVEALKVLGSRCMLGFMASSAALLSAYVTWSLEKALNISNMKCTSIINVMVQGTKQECMLGFMASSAALLSAYVTWSLEKEHFEHEVHEHHQRHGARH
eukprot:s3595_g16.t3